MDDAGILCQLARRSSKDSNNAAESGLNTGKQGTTSSLKPCTIRHFFFSPGHCARKHTMENETDSIGRCFVESFVSSRAQPTPPSLTFQFSIGNHHVGIPAVDLSSHMVIHFCSFNMRISNRPGVHELDNRITTLPCDF